MSTQKISCLAVELKIFYASDADDNSTRRLLSLSLKHLSLCPRPRRRAFHKTYGSKASFGCFQANPRCALEPRARDAQPCFDCRFRGDLFQPFFLKKETTRRPAPASGRSRTTGHGLGDQGLVSRNTSQAPLRAFPPSRLADYKEADCATLTRSASLFPACNVCILRRLLLS